MGKVNTSTTIMKKKPSGTILVNTIKWRSNSFLGLQFRYQNKLLYFLIWRGSSVTRCVHISGAKISKLFIDKRSNGKYFPKFPPNFVVANTFVHIWDNFSHILVLKDLVTQRGSLSPYSQLKMDPEDMSLLFPPCVLTRSFGRFDTHSSYWLYLNVWYLFLPKDHFI